MDIKECCVSLRDYILGRLTAGDAEQPTYPNTINYVAIYDEPAGIGTYTVRITGAFTPSQRFWSERADITLYIDGCEIGEANQRMLELSGWLAEVCSEWSWNQQQKWTIPHSGQPRLAVMPSVNGAQYVLTFQAWTNMKTDARP